MIQRCARVIVPLLVLFAVSVPAAAAPPAGFVDELVAHISSPTAMAFVTNNRLLVTSQTGALRVIQNDALLDAPALNLGDSGLGVLCAQNERGLLGVASDPQFASNHYIYLFYTFKKYAQAADPCPYAQPSNANNPVNRVSRFVLPDSNIIDPSSELVLIDNMISPNGNHNGGDLHFGKDGYLYVSVGDGGCNYLAPHHCYSGNEAAQEQGGLLGKILRITSSGGVPPSNPWQGSDSARCYDPTNGGNQSGRNADGKKCREVFAYGLRNPYRTAFDPNAAGTRFFINDVGLDTWEEIDEGQAGANYGWNIREGFCKAGSTSDCGTPPAGMTNPLYAYAHGTAPNNCNAITGGAFVPVGVWPAAYDGAYLFGDYVCGKIFLLTESGGSYTGSDFFTGVGSVIDLQFGPYSSTQALYYTTYSNSGQLRRLRYTGSANRAPQASAQASPQSGFAPLAVDFDGSGSSDPDGDALSYAWDFGDGGAQASGASATHTYTATGTYTATLTVSDGRGGSDSTALRIDVGNTAPVPTISAPDGSFRYRVGQQITLEGSATDAQDGALPGTQLSWWVLLHHNEHTHPLLLPTSGVSVTITAPAPEDLAAAQTSYLEAFLSATDSQGLTTVTTKVLQPHTVGVTLNTVPAGLALSVNDATVTGPQTILSWENYTLDLTAAEQQDKLGQRWVFDHWSDGGLASHSVQTLASASTYTATFKLAASSTGSYKHWLPLIRR